MNLSGSNVIANAPISSSFSDNLISILLSIKLFFSKAISIICFCKTLFFEANNLFKVSLHISHFMFFTKSSANDCLLKSPDLRALSIVPII